MREQTAEWLGRLLEAHGLGPLQCHRRFRQDLDYISFLFHQPELVVDDLWQRVRKLKQQYPGAFTPAMDRPDEVAASPAAAAEVTPA